MSGLFRFLFVPSKRNQRILTVIFALLGFSAPMLYATIFGFPIPVVPDEFSYLLAADTFAHGRLSNPSPSTWASFEAPHVLVQPSYSSKYPPMQGVFLAVGQLVFGDPAFGIWLSCGFSAAAIFWMLGAWTRQRWAIAGTLLMISSLGVHHYWAQSFWGGMVAAGGGAMFFGAYRRFIKTPSIASALLMTVGGIVLVNARPYEGLAAMTLPLVLLSVRFLRGGFRLSGTARVLLPSAALLSIALSFSAYHNYRVTGHVLTFPYVEHQSQYLSQPLFIFQSRNIPAKSTNARLVQVNKAIDQADSDRSLQARGLPAWFFLKPLYAIAHRAVFLPPSILSPVLGAAFLITILLVWDRRSMSLILGSIGFTFICMSFGAYWEHPHYAAPISCCFFLVTVEGFRRILKKARQTGYHTQAATLIILLTLGSLAYQYVVNSGSIPARYIQAKGIDLNRAIDLNRPVKLEIDARLTFLKRMIESAAQKESGKYLAIVSYESEHDVRDEMTFNLADLETSKLIWAIDLDEERNEKLINAYPDRQALLVSISGPSLTVTPIRKTQIKADYRSPGH